MTLSLLSLALLITSPPGEIPNFAVRVSERLQGVKAQGLGLLREGGLDSPDMFSSGTMLLWGETQSLHEEIIHRGGKAGSCLKSTGPKASL